MSKRIYKEFCTPDMLAEALEGTNYQDLTSFISGLYDEAYLEGFMGKYLLLILPLHLLWKYFQFLFSLSFPLSPIIIRCSEGTYVI